MAVPRRLLLYAGGECLQRYGTLVRGLDPTFTRSGTVGWRRTRSGLYLNSEANTPRVEWVDIDGVATPGWLVEGGTTNLLLQSQTIGTTWANVSSTDSSDADTAPDGTTTADRVIENSDAAAAHTVYQAVTKAASALPYVYSHYLKDGDRGWACIQLSDGGSNGARVWVNLATGALGTSETFGTGWTVDDVGVEYVDGAWWRPWIRVTSDTATTIRATLRLATQDAETTYNGDGSSYILLWGAQLEQKSGGPSSYVPTTTGAASRAAEVANVPWPYKPRAGSFYAKFEERQPTTWASVGGSSPRIWHIGNAASSGDRLLMYKNAGASTYDFRLGNTGDTATSSISLSPSVGDIIELFGTFDGGVVTLQGRKNGGSVSTGSADSLAMPTSWGDDLMTIMGFGSGGQGHVNLLALKIADGAGYSLDEMASA